MNKKILFPVSFIILIIAIGAFFFLRPLKVQAPEIQTPRTGIEATGTPSLFDQTVSLGTFTLGYSSAQFGLAVNAPQVLVHSYIPPCDENFSYCLYFNADTYKGTNFESAGLRIKKRTDLKTSQQCMGTPPEGYTNFTPRIATSTNYMTSVFAPLGDGAAGHYASGALYRLSYHDSCYEFETRIGSSQYANYPEGTIGKFTEADQAAVETKLRAMIESVVLLSGEKAAFPKDK